MSRILLVEDHPLNRKLVRAVLEFRGHEIIEAGNVEQARDRLREHLFDVVLLDIQIPGGGGEAVLRTIREEPTLAELPVVAVTASAMAGDRARLLAAGCDGYISKPIDTKTFASAIEELIRKGRSDAR